MQKYKTLIIAIIVTMLAPYKLLAQQHTDNIINTSNTFGLWALVIVCIIPLTILVINYFFKFLINLKEYKLSKTERNEVNFQQYINDFNNNNGVTKKNKKSCDGNCKDTQKCRNLKNSTSLIILTLCISNNSWAQGNTKLSESLLNQPGIIITIILLLIPILIGTVFALIKATNAIKGYLNEKKLREAIQFAVYLKNDTDINIEEALEKRRSSLSYHLKNNELSGTQKAEDNIGILHNISNQQEVHFTALKKKSVVRPTLEPAITKLILWYLGCSVFWLVIGTGIGEYLGIKFVSPDADHISWLSFGRLRPVHTNIVFWGWASLGMIGLGYYVVPTVSNAKVHSIKWGWIALVLTNLMIILGSLCLMSGINNGGGEFREYIWPVMALFAVALILTLANFILTVAKRTTKEIYISNWYIISAIIFTIIVALTAYLPFWQDGVSETIVQGYFMHSGVGMWFTLFTLGLLYYFIPQQINKPIYAYSLGILAFWTQIIFYTIIGTHHFIFAPIPWWLQTVGIVGSAGMIIPVIAATINFTMTFKGQWHKVSHSYTLPFFLVAVVYYFIVSFQGTAEAFKFTNLLWHFTDFTVAHAHLGFYGIITFALWGGMYAIVPRLTGKEPPQHLVGAHFWLAFIGLLFYAIPLSIGATLRGLMWMEGKPFIDSVTMMFEFWLWRAIGGSLMFIAHLVFAYNFYKMVTKEVKVIDVKEEAFAILATQTEITKKTI
jgi:cytochrome c oxidase cbb3-type subunit I